MPQRKLGEGFVYEPRGPIEIKGIGAQETWFLHRRAPRSWRRRADDDRHTVGPPSNPKRFLMRSKS